MIHSIQGPIEGAARAAPIVLGAADPAPDPTLAHARELTIDVVQTGGGAFVQTGGGDFASRDIDKRQGTFYTIVNPAARPKIERLPHHPPRPRPLRNFLDRTAECARLRPELQPRGGAWLHGPLGGGHTALLHQIANLPGEAALSDGVVYIRGDREPPQLDDIVQGLFHSFYVSDAPVVATPQLARAYLADVQALFLLDHLPLNHDDLVALTDTLAAGAVVVAADSDAPDTLLDLPLRGLPRREAMLLCLTNARIDPRQPGVLPLLGHLCAALHDTPLALLLAARLLRCQVAALPQLVAVLDEIITERRPPLELAVGQAPQASGRSIAPTAPANGAHESLALAAQLALRALHGDEPAVLAALVRVGGPDAEIAALSAISQLPAPAVTAALAHMHELGLVEHEHGRYSVSFMSLRRVLDELLPAGHERERAAAYFAIAVFARAGDLAWSSSEQANLIAAVETSLATGQPGQAGRLAQAIQPALMLSGRWGSWGQVIEWADRAATDSGDAELHAWATHERGTRAGLMGDRAAAVSNLAQSQQLHHQLGDRAAAAVSKHNLRYLVPPVAWPWPEIEPRVVIAVALAIVALVVVLILIFRPHTPALLSETTDEDMPVTFSVIADRLCQPGADAPTMSILTDPSNGLATIDPATGCITYAPDPNFSGSDSLTYSSGGTTITGTVDLSVRPVADPPIPGDDGVVADEDTPLAINLALLLANDSDADGDTLVVSGVETPSAQGGAVALIGGAADSGPVGGDTLRLVAFETGSAQGGAAALANGTIVYTPTANFNGADRFTYTISDGHGKSATCAVRIRVRPVNDPPRAGSHSATTSQDTPIDIALAALLSTASDVDSDTLAIDGVGATSAQGGAVALAGDTITYTPAPGFSGPDSFAYTIADGHGGTAVAAVSIQVNPVTPPNSAPVAGGDSFSTGAGAPLTIAVSDLLANDIDPDGDPLAIIDVSPASAQGGAVVLAGDTITYTPAPGFSGPDSFTYTVADGRGGEATATVGVEVAREPHLPIAKDDDSITDEDSGAKVIDVLANDTSAPDNGETLTIVAVSQPAHGAAAIAEAGAVLTYAPAAEFSGPDSFTYTITDGRDGQTTATVSVTVRPHVNAREDSANVAEDSGATAIDVLRNDRGDRLRITSAGQASNGSVAIAAGGRRLTYTPNLNYNGADRFSYTIIGDSGGRDSATVAITVEPRNDPPTVGADTAETFEDTILTIPVATLLSNDSDPDIGDVLTLTGVSPTSTQGGIVVLNGDAVEYTPPYSTGFSSGADQFTYQVCDNGTPALCATGIVAVQVQPAPTSLPAATDTPVPTPTITPIIPPPFTTIPVPVMASPDGTPKQIDYDPACSSSQTFSIIFQGSLSDSSIISGSVVLLYRLWSYNAPGFSALPVVMGNNGAYSAVLYINSSELAAALQDSLGNPTSGALEYQTMATNSSDVIGYSPLKQDIIITRKVLC
ncbi:MAG: Ig-like domain-containing protein [Roseiflexaceae bacterium]